MILLMNIALLHLSPINIFWGIINKSNDTPPSSLMDSTMSPKVKTTKGKGIKAHSLARSISSVENVCWSFGMGISKIDKQVTYSHKLA
jgi:hypothetical protein